MPPADSTVHIYQSRSNVPSDAPDSIVIDEIIQSIDEADANDLYRRLVQLNIGDDSVPVYDIICHQIWRDGGSLHENSPLSMELLILLYEYLDEEIGASTEVIECYGIRGRYADLLRDFATNNDLRISFDAEQEAAKTDRYFLNSGLIKMFLTFIDIVLSIVLKPIFEIGGKKIIVDYPIGRPDTFRPIERRLDIGFDALFSSLTVSYFRNYRSLSDTATTDRPLFCSETFVGLLSQLNFAVPFVWDTAVEGSTASELTDAVAAETGVRLERTVPRLYRRAAAFNMSAVLRYGTARRAFERGDYETLLLTSGGPIGKSLGFAARSAGLSVYMLPHSIANQYVGLEAQFEHTVFSEGTITASTLASDPLVRPVETGLPKHQKIKNQRQRLEPGSEGGTVLVGTQPYDDDRREEFATDVVTAVLDVTDRPIVVKTHPGETEAFYRARLDTLDISPADRERITVTGGDLYRHIVDSDLLVTISSNVGIESVILGTPAVSYNPRTPDNRAPLYCKYGSVPHVQTPSGFRDLLAEEDLDTMAERQAAMLDGPYDVTDNSLDRIATRIGTELQATLAGSD